MSDDVKPDEVRQVVEETLQEWLQGYVSLEDDGTNTGYRQCRVRRVGDKTYEFTDPGGYVDYGKFEINITVTEVTNEQVRHQANG